MRDYIRKPCNWFIVAIVLACIFALINSFQSASRTNLPSYVPQEESPKQEEYAPDIRTTEYFNEETGLSMLVPEEWTRVTRNGCDAFVNHVDGAILLFDVHEYDPTMNDITEEQVTNDVIASNGVLGGFAKGDNHSYLVIYELGSADYFEYNVWDLQNTVRVSLQIPTERYSYYYDIAIYLFDSFSWEQAAPIPAEFCMFYSEYGNFEFGVPIGWEGSIIDGEYSAVSPNGSVMACSLTSTSADLSGITQIDYVNAASAGKSNYLLSSYSNTGSVLTAEATYVLNGVECAEVRSILATGAFQYEFTFQCERKFYDTDDQYFMTAINLFRIFD